MTKSAPRIPARPARLPLDEVESLDGWDARWSRLVTVDTFDGERTFHVLDSLAAMQEDAPDEPIAGTILALHGNPTWSYLWRHLAAAGMVGRGADGTRAGRWRVIAPDQLDMGFSERLDHDRAPRPFDTGIRRIADRVRDFDAVVTALLAESPTGAPVVTIGHDWGGLLSLTWAARNQHRISAVMTLNTAAGQPEGTSLPLPLQTALAGPMLPMTTVHTDAFIRVTLGLAKPALRPEVRASYRAPYPRAVDRGGIGGFVAEIPAMDTHPSYAELQQLGEDIAGITLPTLIVWGPKDPVFVENYLRDLRTRIPHADLHRFEKAGHMLVDEADVAGVCLRWLTDRFPATAPGAEGSAAAGGSSAEAVSGEQAGSGEPASAPAAAAVTAEPRPSHPAPVSRADRLYWFENLFAQAENDGLASVDMTKNPPQRVTWRQLARVTGGIAAGLRKAGLRPGDRVSLLVPPGNTLTAVVYGVMRAGGTAVIADAGLGPKGMTRAVKAADPQWIIGELPGLTLARAGGWPGRRISVTDLGAVRSKLLGVETTITELSKTPYDPEMELPDPDSDAAVLFTSGSTGPAKGVRYTHRRMAILAGVLADGLQVRPGSSLVAGFAPFALLGPGIGAVSVTPNMSVTKPRTLTASALLDAVIAGEATQIFASPAAWKNVVATSGDLTPEQREACGQIELLLSAGAPVPLALMDAVSALFPHASFHSPYGMTEGLMLTDIGSDEAHAAAASGNLGVCVGRPVEGVRLALAPIGEDGTPSEELLEGEAARGVLGEFVASAAHLKAGYDRLWNTDRDASRDTVDGLLWHRTNDIGRFDDEGRVWLEGRVQHILTTAAGPLGPGGPEAAVDRLPGVARSAVVGVGPKGAQAVVVIVEPEADAAEALGEALPKHGPAPLGLSSAVRSSVADACGVDVAAVLVTADFPTDIRHNSKIDRPRLAAWADTVLAGGSVTAP